MARTEQSILSGPRLAGALVLALVLASCSSTPSGPPSNQDNVCAIFDERPEWYEAAQAAALKWGAPIEVQMAIIWKESSFRAEARPPKEYALGLIPLGRPSSAYGYPQALDGTWEWYRSDTGNSGADRDDFDDASDFVGWYMAKTRQMIGIDMNDAFSQYIAYHQGHAGYRSGRWKGNDWLRQAAGKVASQAARYRVQLSNC